MYVRLSVCPSNAWIVTKRKKLVTTYLHIFFILLSFVLVIVPFTALFATYSYDVIADFRFCQGGSRHVQL